MPKPLGLSRQDAEHQATGRFALHRSRSRLKIFSRKMVYRGGRLEGCDW
jgi:hypothetical protein